MKEVYFKMAIKNADVKKIFASVGTHPQAFDRLLKELDRIAPKHSEWEIIAQAGNSNYKPKKFAFKKNELFLLPERSLYTSIKP